MQWLKGLTLVTAVASSALSHHSSLAQDSKWSVSQFVNLEARADTEQGNLCEAVRVLEPLFEAGSLNAEDRIVSNAPDAPAGFRTLDVILKGGSAELGFIGDNGRTPGTIPLPLQVLGTAHHYVARSRFYAVIFGYANNGFATYLVQGTISNRVFDASQATVDRIEQLNGADIRAIGNARTRFFVLERTPEACATLRSFEFDQGIKENPRQDIHLTLSDIAVANFDITRSTRTYLAIADTREFHVIDLRNEPRVETVKTSIGSNPRHGIQVMENGSTDRHYFVGHDNGLIQRYVYAYGDLYEPTPIPISLKARESIEYSAGVNLLGFDTLVQELIVSSPNSDTITTISVSEDLTVTGKVQLSRAEVQPYRMGLLNDQYRSGVRLEIKLDGKLYHYAERIVATPCFISTFSDEFFSVTPPADDFIGYSLVSTTGGTGVTVSYQYSPDKGTTWYELSSGKEVETLAQGLTSGLNLCENKNACVTKKIEDLSVLLNANMNNGASEAFTVTKDNANWYWRVLAKNSVGITYSNVRHRNDSDNKVSSSAVTSESSATPEPSSLLPSSSPSPTSSPSSSESTPESSASVEPTKPPVPPNEGVCNKGATLWWELSAYSREWNPTSFGNIVAGETDAKFVFKDGVTYTSADGTNVTYWDGVVWYRPYSSKDSPSMLLNFPWMNFSNPILTIKPNGSGNIKFDVNWFNGFGVFSIGSKRVTVLDWTGVERKSFESYSNYTITPIYKGRKYVTPGYFDTETYPDSFPKEYLDWLDQNIRAWFFKTGASMDQEKVPLPFTLQLRDDSPCSPFSSSSVPEPSSSVTEPSSSIPEPTSSTPESSSSVPEPSSSVTEPSSSVTEPSSSIPEPTSSTPESSSSVPEPSSSVTEPSSSVTEPSSSIPEPTSSTPESSSSVPEPSSSVTEPSSSIPQPTQTTDFIYHINSTLTVEDGPVVDISLVDDRLFFVLEVESQSSVSWISAGNLTMTDTRIPLNGGEPVALAYSKDENELYVVHINVTGLGAISVFNTQTNILLRSIEQDGPPSNTKAVVYSDATNKLYLGGGSLVIPFEPQSSRFGVPVSITPGNDGDVRGLALDDGAGNVFVAESTHGAITSYNITSDAWVSSPKISIYDSNEIGGHEISSLGFDPSKQLLVVSIEHEEWNYAKVVAIDAKNHVISGNEPIRVGKSVQSITVNPVTHDIYIASAADQIIIAIDPDTWTIKGTMDPVKGIKLRRDVSGVALFKVVVSPDGKRVYASLPSSRHIAVIDLGEAPAPDPNSSVVSDSSSSVETSTDLTITFKPTGASASGSATTILGPTSVTLPETTVTVDTSSDISLTVDPKPTNTENSISVITTIVTAYTTYCPDPTTFVEGSSTYTVTEPTTLTITDCPCTLTQTVRLTVTVLPRPSTFTQVVKAYTTYCPEPTVFTHGSQTITVTAPTTLSITDCPCTLTHIIPKSAPSGSEAVKPAPSGETSEVPKPTPSGQTSQAPKATLSGEAHIPPPKGSGSANFLNVALALAAFALFWF